jgi:3-dehydro-4-phosphotetronate decarboxylase
MSDQPRDQAPVERSEGVSEGLCEELCEAAASFYARGYAFGSTGNLSVRVGDQVWITPTGQSLKALRPARLACVTLAGDSLNDNRPSKEFPFHAAIYRQRPEARAVVHLHSGWATALACLADLDEAEPLPPITPYYLMRVAPLGVLSYFRPGSSELAGSCATTARSPPGRRSAKPLTGPKSWRRRRGSTSNCAASACAA